MKHSDYTAEMRWQGVRIETVRPTLDDGLRALEEATRLAASIRIELDDEYLRAIALAEALPQNQAGTDKTWVWRMDRAFKDTYARARYAGRPR